MPIYPNHRAVFVHIPKNGGSTITTLLKRDRFLGRRVNRVDPRGVGCEVISDYLQALEDESESYFKFSFVRNPWDRFVSAYHYICQRRPEIKEVVSLGSFDNFVSEFSHDPDTFLGIRYFKPQWKYLTDHTGSVPMDFVGRFEQFEDDLAIALKAIGLRRSVIRHRKQTKRKDYRDYYSSSSRGVIASVYARDIDLFSYEFENGTRRRNSSLLRFLD